MQTKNTKYYNNLKYEEELYNEILRVLDWRWYTENNGEKILTRDGIFPIWVKKKILVKYDRRRKDITDKYVTFRPFKNSLHCQYLLDFIVGDYNNGEHDTDIYTFKDKDTNLYSIVFIDNTENEIILQIDGCKKEIEAKYRLFMLYCFGDKFDKKIDRMLKDEEDFYNNKKKDKE